MYSLKLNAPILLNSSSFDFPLPLGLSLVNQLSSVVSGFENVAMALAVWPSCRWPSCPGFIPSLKGVIKADGPSFFGPAPLRWILRAGVVKDLCPLAPLMTLLFVAPVASGVDARGCRGPAVVSTGRPESWLAGLSGELATRFPIAL